MSNGPRPQPIVIVSDAAYTGGIFPVRADMGPVASLRALDDVAARIPPPSTTAPPAAGTMGATGQERTFARADHTHEVRARRKRVVLGADGTARWIFDKPIATKPIINSGVETDGGLPVFVEAVAWEGSAATGWTAVTVRGSRFQNTAGTLTLPSILTALANFNPLGGSAAGITVGLTAAEETPVTA